MSAPTIQQLADHLGVSRPRIIQLRDDDGMPCNTLKAAKLWRQSQNKKREATNAKRKSGKLAKTEMKYRGRPIKPAKASDTGDSLLDALNNSVMIANAAFRAYQIAMASNWPTQTMRLSDHSRAMDARLKAEKAYREEMERRSILVEKTVVTDMARRAIDAVIRLVKKLPNEQGPQCNPAEPLMATQILQRKVNEIIAAAREAVGTL